ncbi:MULTISPECIES: M13 family metallopeptidase [unclassified Sphingomonas]|uniref:M13 family metallopeptidase n=1 Tax=unclassified Sphingomonas TaxID=196159 RepID=UPI0006F3CB9F|nr:MULTISPECIES: M13 family metallopeptidase [unclassified Sphingomonas]KQM61418.1 peptidase M13 [Sphingomonas sp. Leaf16]KQN12513.1 peptidase M13 [Sphingomonas sp. Leaf29]KQN18993.1 peptidase M13 [Sphingomonas sp. Leaf32]
MRRSFVLTTLLAASALSACATTPPPQTGNADPIPVTETAAPAPKPEIGDFGFDVAGMDRSVKAGDNFYKYANGNWEKITPIPADKSNYGMFTALDDLSKTRTRELLDAAKGDPNSKIGVAYATYLDQAAIEAKGLAPIQPWLNEIKGLSSKAGYAALTAKASQAGVGAPFGAYVGPDDKQPTVYALQTSQGGLGMPDRDYYLSTDAKLVEQRKAYQAHLAKMLTLAGEPNAAARAAAVVAFETQIARAHWTRIESRDANKTYNKMSVADLQRRAPGFDFATYFRGLGANTTDVIVAQPSAFAGMAKVIGAAPIGVLKDQLLVRSLDTFASVLPQTFDKESFAFFGTVLSGTPQQEERWKRAVDFTSDAVADDVSKAYVAKFFPPATKAAADELVRNVTEAMGRRIDNLDWMAPETKAKARAKLAAFTPKIGYPDQWRDMTDLTITPGDAFGNMLRANQWQQRYNVQHLGKPIQKWEWFMTPMTVNAYANPVMNEIVFPAAILQPPFFDPNADPAVNYGAIGAVIGHEISHHFDDQGRKYDVNGSLTDWWTAEDVKRFEERTAALVKQYDAYEPLPGLHVKGELTLGENIADLAGLTAAWDAYTHAYPNDRKVIDGFGPEQRFYLGWAQVWRRSYREANLRQRLLTDPHSPSEQRAWVVRNLDPWYQGYKPAMGEYLFLSPEQRVRIW